MLVSVFGTSTPYGFWGFNAVRHVMQVVYGDHHHIHCLRIEDLRQSWPASDGKPVVFTSDCPDTEISDLFIGSGAPIIAFLDEPEDAIAFSMLSRGLDISAVVGFSTYCFCSLYYILRSPETFCFPSRHMADDVSNIFVKLLKILVGSVDPGHLEKVMQRAVFDYKAGQFTTVKNQIETDWGNCTLPAEALAMQPIEIKNTIMSVGEAFRPVFEGKPLLRVECPRELLFTCNKGNGKPELIDLTGPARCLLWGPYLHLPKGDWIAKVEFEITENYSGAFLEADVHDGQGLLIVAQTELPIEGIFSFILRFTIQHLYQQIQVRASLCNGAIEGKFGLRSISLLRGDLQADHEFLQIKSECPVERSGVFCPQP